MYQYPYVPFQKMLEEVTGDDLIALKHVSEGWYVDYKRDPLDIRDLAKHISAFANQYGGWLFFGVSESNENRVACSFPGIPLADVHALSLRLREAISAHVNPSVLYEERVIAGPCKTIELPEGRAIVIVGIPQGVDPPYIHSSGKIYQRLADQSKPKAESDRHALDLLWDRGKTYRGRISDRLRRTPELRETQKDSTWAFIFLSPDLRRPAPKDLLTFKAFRQLVNQPDPSMGVSLPLQEVRSAEFGYQGRHVENNNPEYGTVALRWWHGGVARLDIPINTWNTTEFRDRSRGYKHADDFLAELVSQGHQNAQICDFSWLIYIVAALTNMYTNIQRAVGDPRPVYAACELRNLFYKIPFFNSSRYVEKCRDDRVPIITDRLSICPERPFFDNMFEIEADVNTADPANANSFVRIATILQWMLNTVGIVSDLDELQGYSELWENHSAAYRRSIGPKAVS